LGEPDRFREWQEVHDRAAGGDKKAVTDLIATLDTALVEDPDDQLARVYLGSAWTMRSRDLGLGPKKLEALKKGGALMDEAVNAAPDKPRVRLIRAVNALQVPAIFKRRPIAYDDFRRLTTPPLLNEVDKLADEERQAVWYFAGNARQAEGKADSAREAWKTALEIAPSSALAPAIRKALDQ
jgi:tetratricopeptide (TPR) repeat protein